MGNKTDTTVDGTYNPSIERGIATSTTTIFYPRLLSFFSRYNHIENEYNIASYRLMPTNSNVGSCNIAFHRRFSVHSLNYQLLQILNTNLKYCSSLVVPHLNMRGQIQPALIGRTVHG